MEYLINHTDEIKLIATLVGLVGGVIAIYKFVQKIREDQIDTRQQKKRKWLEAAVHAEFNGTDKPSLSFQEIQKQLSSSAFFNMANLKMTQEELGEASLRLLIVSMIEKGVLSQLKNDEYQLKIQQSELMFGNANLQREIALEAIKLIAGEPGQLNSRGLHARISETLSKDIEFSLFENILYALQNDSSIIEIDGLWEPDR